MAVSDEPSNNTVSLKDVHDGSVGTERDEIANGEVELRRESRADVTELRSDGGDAPVHAGDATCFEICAERAKLVAA
jgi:hypothetical protein